MSVEPSGADRTPESGPGGSSVSDTFADALSAAVDALTAAGVDTPRLDAELLLCAASGITREELAAAPEALLDAGAGRRFAGSVRRRLRREPVAYILGRRSFRYLELAADSRALIPRPETELLVEVALEERAKRILEIGSGSGAVAIALASEAPDVEVVATDISAAALELARENAIKVGVSDRVQFEVGMLPATGPIDLVVANLPYVPESDWGSLATEITGYEPREALVGGIDGLTVIRDAVASLSASNRVDASVLAFEVGEGQAAAVAEILTGGGWPHTESRRDLAGIERVVIGRRTAAG